MKTTLEEIGELRELCKKADKDWVSFKHELELARLVPALLDDLEAALGMEEELKDTGSEQRYYIMNRGPVGNCALWWAKGGKGYVCEIDKAGAYTIEEALENTHREVDVLWPVELVDEHAVRHFRGDMCNLDTRGKVITAKDAHSAALKKASE
jgi:hypothetical protein